MTAGMGIYISPMLFGTQQEKSLISRPSEVSESSNYHAYSENGGNDPTLSKSVADAV